ncbi:hypothetical protein [Sphingomonas montanisoli]|uniref:Uncharacterized protein n=1 Tax=Sphingomonas montanisoli TaxID=2606412 RepID=A0A5D9C7B9_9SPHN|nr:hypothetical protein [Sphingomonas montanisoli]TZG25891.1 hypothetical protein FYJ91_13000 [Sphingomonas montanisoli]
MFVAAAASGPETRKAGTAMPTSHIFHHNSVYENTSEAAFAQPHLELIPRIIATHWLRPEVAEAAHG